MSDALEFRIDRQSNVLRLRCSIQEVVKRLRYCVAGITPAQDIVEVGFDLGLAVEQRGVIARDVGRIRIGKTASVPSMLAHGLGQDCSTSVEDRASIRS